MLWFASGCSELGPFYWPYLASVIRHTCLVFVFLESYTVFNSFALQMRLFGSSVGACLQFSGVSYVVTAYQLSDKITHALENRRSELGLIFNAIIR